jgi:hypothetical protein
MVPVALTFAVLNEGHGTADVGYVLAAETVPLVALLLVGGVVADRFGRRATMLAADAGRLVSQGLLAVLLLTGSPSLWVFTLGAGSIDGALAALRFRPRRPLVAATLGTAVFALPLGLIALPGSTVAIAAAAGAAGFGVSIFATLWDTTMQRTIPAAILSRVSAYDWFGSVAFVPLGYLLAAPLASALGDRGALLLGAVVVIGSCAVVLASRSVRGLR